MQLQINTPRVVHETVDSEVIAIDFENGNYYCLRNTAACIWSLIERGASVEQAVVAVAQRFRTELGAVREDVVAFVEQLRARELVVPREQATEPFEVDVTSEDGSSPYQRPQLDQYTDLQQLLLLDPIHEINQSAGWPQAQT